MSDEQTTVSAVFFSRDNFTKQISKSTSKNISSRTWLTSFKGNRLALSLWNSKPSHWLQTHNSTKFLELKQQRTYSSFLRSTSSEWKQHRKVQQKVCSDLWTLRNGLWKVHKKSWENIDIFRNYQIFDTNHQSTENS